MAFDLLCQENRDLTARPPRDRRARLEDVVANNDLVFSVHRLAPDGLEAWMEGDRARVRGWPSLRSLTRPQPPRYRRQT